MSTLDSRAEVARMSRLLGVDAAELAFLEKLDSEALLEFRLQLVDVFYDANPGLARFAKLANMLPSAVIAKLTVEAVGPLLASRIVGQVDTAQAVSVLKRVPIDFVCDVTVETDPRRVEALFSESPTKIAKQVADGLIERKEYVAIGQLIGYVEDEVMQHALDNASDEDVLSASFMAEDKDRIGDGVRMLSDKRIKSILSTAGKKQLFSEAIDLMSHLETDEFVRVSDQAMKLTPKMLDDLLRLAQDDDYWYVVVPAICLSADPTPLIDALIRADADVVSGFADAVVGGYADDLSDLSERVDSATFADLRDRLDGCGARDLLAA